MDNYLLNTNVTGSSIVQESSAEYMTPSTETGCPELLTIKPNEEVAVDEKRYGVNKPRRIIIRAKISRD